MGKTKKKVGDIARHHLSELLGSGIDNATRSKAGVFSESRPDRQAEMLHWKSGWSGLGNCLCFSYRTLTGELNGYVRLKPDNPREKGGKKVKYEAPVGESPKPYFPPDIADFATDPSKPLLITEGEKKTLAAYIAGFCCIGIAGVDCWSVPRKFPKRLSEELQQVAWKGRKVYIVPDSDIAEKQDVHRAEGELGKALEKQGAEVHYVRLRPAEGEEKVGLDDFLIAERNKLGKSNDLKDAAPALQALLDAAPTEQPPYEGEDQPDSAAGILVGAIKSAEGVELFATPDGLAYASVPHGQAIETFPMKSVAFRSWVQGFAYRELGCPAPDATVRTTVATLEAEALFGDSPRQQVFTRIGQGPDGSIWLDLANGAGEAVCVTADGWTIAKPTIRFVRRRGQLELPRPERGGSLKALRRLCNVSDEDWPLVVGWLIAAFRPVGPYPVLCFAGEQGATKSSLAKVLKELIDPGKPALRAEPKELRDLMIAASNSWLLAFDNLSHLTPWLSDAFCRLATGGGFGVRQLYADDEEMLFDVQRSCLLNGIEELPQRSDLLDRSLIVELPQVSPERRRTEESYKAECHQLRPGILGALLDAVATGLRRLPKVHLPALPRLADFACWVSACEPALGLKEGEFLEALERNRQTAHGLALESSPVGPLVLRLAGEGEWVGSPSELLAKLKRLGGFLRPPHGFPQNPRALSGVVKRLAPNFRSQGVEVTLYREHGGNRERRIRIAATVGTQEGRKQGRKQGRKTGAKK